VSLTASTSDTTGGVERIQTEIFDTKNQPRIRSKPTQPARTTIPETKAGTHTATARPRVQTRNRSAIGPVLVLLLVIFGFIGGGVRLLDTEPEAQPELPTPARRAPTPTATLPTPTPTPAPQAPTPAPQAPTPAPQAPTPAQASDRKSPPETPSQAQANPGYLKIKSSRPYFGWVHIDGKKQPGLSTPVHSKIKLPAGNHTVRLESSERPGALGQRKTVTIRSGQTTVLGAYDFLKEKWQP
jgi:hypothetical protein